MLFPRRALRFVFLSLGGFDQPGACNQALQPTQGVVLIPQGVLPRYVWVASRPHLRGLASTLHGGRRQAVPTRNVVPRKRRTLADASANPPPRTNGSAWQQTPEAARTGPLGAVALVLFPRLFLWDRFGGQGGFGRPGACNQALQPTQGVSLIPYLVLPRLCVR